MGYIQTTMFPETDVSEMMGAIAKVKKEVGNIRRGFFARHEEIMETQDAMKEEIKFLKSELQELRGEILSLRRNNAYTPWLVGGVTVDAGLTSGLSSTSLPVSAFMISSQASSTALSLPRK